MSIMSAYSQPSSVVLPLDMEHGAVSGDCSLERSEEGVLWRMGPSVNQSTMSFDLDKLGLNPRRFDEIHIRFKPVGGIVLFMPELTAFPVKGLRRHWYSKIVMNPGEWTTARFDLRLDDDGWQRGDWDTRTLNLRMVKRFLRTPGEPAWRDVHIASIAFVHRPVDVSFDEFAATVERDKKEVRWTYELRVANRLGRAAKVRVRLATGTFREFQPSWRRRTLDLAPREVRTLLLTMNIPAERAAQLPALYSEKAQLFARCDGEDGVEITPLHGFRPRYLWATIPPQKTALDLPPLKPDSQEKFLARAATALDAEWGVPLHGPAIHPQGYIDPDTSENLQPLTWFRHEARKAEKVYTDEKYTLAHITGIHVENFKRARLLAEASIVGGDPVFAEASRDVFLEYAHWYPFMPATAPGSTAGRTRLGQSTLMTAFIFANVTDAYARLCESGVLRDSDRERIESGFLVPEMRALYGHTVEYSNMTVHHYEAYTRCVVAMQRHWNLFGEALYGDHGFHAMVDRSFTEDGMSLEGGVYHWFTLSPLMDFVRQMDRYGVNVLGDRFKRVFDGTREHTPQGIVTNSMLGSQYAFAYKAYRDPAYIPTLKYRGEWPPAFLSKAEARKEEARAPAPMTETTLQEHNGYVWLREKSSRGFRALSINTIMQWERGELDRLHYSLFDPDMLTQDIGRIVYGAKCSNLMCATPAHNAVTVDCRDQLDLPSTIAVLRRRPRLPAALITENAESPIYPGIRFARVVAILDGVFFIGDVLQAVDGAEHTFDWPFYGVWEPWAHAEAGSFQTDLALAPVASPLGSTPWYQALSEARSGSVAEGCVIRVPTVAGVGMGARAKRDAPTRMLHVHAAPSPDMKLITARIPRGYRPAPGPVMFLRVEKRTQARFGVAIAVTEKGGSNPVAVVESLDVGDGVFAAAWRVRLDDGQSYLVVVNRGGTPLTVDGETFGELLTVRAE